MTVIRRHVTDLREKEIGEFHSWDEAEEAVAKECGGIVPSFQPVTTNASQWEWDHLVRRADYLAGEFVFRVTEYDR